MNSIFFLCGIAKYLLFRVTANVSCLAEDLTRVRMPPRFEFAFLQDIGSCRHF